MRRDEVAPVPSTATNAFVMATEILLASKEENKPFRRMT
jgi:hypothetical protein